jgi:hypothetical protein
MQQRKPRCGHCGGKFGLIRYLHHNLPLCSKRCREAYLEKITQDRERLRHWFSFLGRGSNA